MILAGEIRSTVVGGGTQSHCQLVSQHKLTFLRSQGPLHSRAVEVRPEINSLSTKLYLSDVNIQFVPRSKHSLLRF